MNIIIKKTYKKTINKRNGLIIIDEKMSKCGFKKSKLLISSPHTNDSAAHLAPSEVCTKAMISMLATRTIDHNIIIINLLFFESVIRLLAPKPARTEMEKPHK